MKWTHVRCHVKWISCVSGGFFINSIWAGKRALEQQRNCRRQKKQKTYDMKRNHIISSSSLLTSIRLRSFHSAHRHSEIIIKLFVERELPHRRERKRTYAFVFASRLIELRANRGNWIDSIKQKLIPNWTLLNIHGTKIVTTNTAHPERAPAELIKSYRSIVSVCVTVNDPNDS